MEHKELSEQAKQAQYERPSWATNPYQPPQNLDEITQRAITMYMYSKQRDGTMGGIGWWQSANGYTAMAMHDLWSRSHKNYKELSEAVKTAESTHSHLLNGYNDDTLWWALCCLHIYDMAGDPWFYDQAENIWHEMHRRHAICGRGQVWFRGRDMEGACYWTDNEDEESINTVTTGLYAELSARLALIERARHKDDAEWVAKQKHSGDGEFIQAARCSLGWILRCRYRSEAGIVLDGIMLRKDEEVDWTFTYVTGIAMGVCALMYELLGQPEYLDLALHVANKAMRKESWITADGVLLEWDAFGHGKHDPWESGDGVGFKAVLMRHFATLYDVLQRMQPPYRKAMETASLIRTFVNVNFQSQQERNTNGNGQYGPWWAGPFEAPSSHSQMAALDVMAAVRAVNAR